MGKAALYRRRGSVARPSGFAYDPPSDWLAFTEEFTLLVNVADPLPPGAAYYVGRWRIPGEAWHVGLMGTDQSNDFPVDVLPGNGLYEVGVAYRAEGPEYTFLSDWSVSKVVEVNA